jgi:hypothetical protein
MFSNCYTLEKIPEIRINHTSISNTQGMFNNCWNLKEVPSLKYDFQSTVSARYNQMFYYCYALEKIGEPDVIRKHQFEFELVVLGANIKIKRPLVYKYNDAVLGEVYEPFDIVPEITSEFEQKIEIFKPNEVKKIGVKIWAEKQNVQGTIALNLPKDWKIIPQEQNFEIKTKGTYQTVYFDVK